MIGRFLFQRVNRGLDGEKTDLETLLKKAGLDRDDARSRLAFAPSVEARLKAFEVAETGRTEGWLNALRFVFWLPLVQYRVYWQCARELNVLLPQMAKSQNWSAADLVRRRVRSKKLVALSAVGGAGGPVFGLRQFVFSLARGAHSVCVFADRDRVGARVCGPRLLSHANTYCASCSC